MTANIHANAFTSAKYLIALGEASPFEVGRLAK